jgi:hypothetical protein
MKVRMLVSIAGHAEPAYSLPEFSFSPGDEVDLDPALAKAWLESGHAEKVRGRSQSVAPAAEEPQPAAEEPQKDSE